MSSTFHEEELVSLCIFTNACLRLIYVGAMLPLLLLSYLLMWKSVAVPLTPLPGLDELQSGFDVVKMLSIHEQNLPSKLFDLEDSSKDKTYAYNILGIDRSHITPQTVQVSDVDLRVEKYCQTVAHIFAELCSRCVFRITLFFYFILSCLLVIFNRIHWNSRMYVNKNQ